MTETEYSIYGKTKNRGNEKGQAIAKLIMEQYQPQNKEEMQDAIKDVFGPMLEAMLQGEMDNHLGYTSNDHGSKDTDNRRNGYIGKTFMASACRRKVFQTSQTVCLRKLKSGRIVPSSPFIPLYL